MTKPIFPVAMTGTLHFSDGLPNEGHPEEAVNPQAICEKVAAYRGIFRFEWTEAVHLSRDEKLNQKIANPKEASDLDLYIPFDQVNLDNFIIRNMGECGYGLFANRDIPGETPLFLYAGEYVATSQSNLDGTRDRTTYVSMFSCGPGQVDAECRGGIAGFAQYLPTQTPSNAAYVAEQQVATANMRVVQACYRGYRYAILISMRDIKKDEILGWDYSLGYWMVPERCGILRFFTPQAKTHSASNSATILQRLNEFDKQERKSIKPGINLEATHHTLTTYKHAFLVYDLRNGIIAGQSTHVFSYLSFLPKSVLFNELADNELELLYHQMDKIKEVAELSEMNLVTQYQKVCATQIFPQSIPFLRENRLKKDLPLYHVNEAYHDRFPGRPRKNDITISRDTFVTYLYTKGIEAYQMGDYQKALSIWKLIKKVFKENKDEKALIKSYWNMGNALFKLKNNEKAVKKLKKGEAKSIAFFTQHPAVSDVKKPEEFKERLALVQPKPL